MYDTIQEVIHKPYQNNEELSPNQIAKGYNEALAMTPNDAYGPHHDNGQTSPQISKGYDITLNDAYGYTCTQKTSINRHPLQTIILKYCIRFKLLILPIALPSISCVEFFASYFSELARACVHFIDKSPDFSPLPI